MPDPHDPAPADSHAARLLREACVHADRLATAAPGRPRRLTVRDGDASVELEWDTTAPAPAATPVTPAPAAVEPAPDNGQHAICSPMVGVYYATPQPGAAAFVRVGDTVVPGQQVALIEAMKLMIPVEADRPGRVAELLVPPETPVEYGQPLIALEPAG